MVVVVVVVLLLVVARVSLEPLLSTPSTAASTSSAPYSLVAAAATVSIAVEAGRKLGMVVVLGLALRRPEVRHKFCGVCGKTEVVLLLLLVRLVVVMVVELVRTWLVESSAQMQR